jgi:hypothetical protein
MLLCGELGTRLMDKTAYVNFEVVPMLYYPLRRSYRTERDDVLISKGFYFLQFEDISPCRNIAFLTLYHEILIEKMLTSSSWR